MVVSEKGGFNDDGRPRANPDKFQFIIFGKTNAIPLDLGTGIMLEPLRCMFKHTWSFYRQYAKF